MKEVDSGDWNHDCNITEIKFENQIGLAKVNRSEDNASIEFSYNLDATGSLKVPVISIIASVGATVNVKNGDVLDFDNPDRAAVITVKSHFGETVDWTVTMNPFTEPLSGTWKIASIYVYGGVDRGIYGGDAFVLLNALTTTLFTGKNLPSNELDNTYTFTLTGFLSNGNPYGTIVNDAGQDGLFGGYVYNNGGELWNCERIYRKIPVAGGTWEHDIILNTYSIRNELGQVIASTTLKTSPFSYQLTSNSKTMDFPANTFVFDVSQQGLNRGSWDAIYSNLDYIAWNPATLFISLEK
jgi:hypothetical protein